jgi:F0F1-type ATP synthase membrane subunit b/b'
MSDTPVTRARPVSLFTIVFLFAVFAAFLLVIRYLYHPATTSAFNAAPDNIPQELEWKANAANRRKALKDLQDQEAAQLSSYAWIDQQAGAVRLPIERAMELTARDLASKQQVRQIRDLPGDTARPKL